MRNKNPAIAVLKNCFQLILIGIFKILAIPKIKKLETINLVDANINTGNSVIAILFKR